MAAVTKNVEVAGRRISIETGRVAEQANGAVVIRQGDTVVLSTAVMANEPREGIDFLPARAETQSCRNFGISCQASSTVRFDTCT